MLTIPEDWTADQLRAALRNCRLKLTVANKSGAVFTWEPALWEFLCGGCCSMNGMRIDDVKDIIIEGLNGLPPLPPVGGR